MMKAFFLTLIAISFLFPSLKVMAWGGRGHNTICEAAVFLLKEKSFKDSLQQKPFLMGHLCNIPDFYWRSLSPEFTKLGNPTHFVDVEITGLAIKDVPLDYKQIVETYTGKISQFNKETTIRNVPTEFGSNWWRADQFFRRAVALGKDWKTSPAPANGKEEQDENFPYNKNTYNFYLNLGLMGHFVGDNSQPFHCTGDYDGYAAGHGGIHAYFEDAIVGTMPYNLMAKVVEEGQRMQKMAVSKNKSEQTQVRFLNQKTVLEKMRSLGEISVAEIPLIYSLDKLKKPSIDKSEKGMSLRTAAERESAELSNPKFQKLILKELARSAVLLAQLWDEAYVQVGQPKLGAYKSYKFPFTAEFIPPDYFEIKAEEKKAK